MLTCKEASYIVSRSLDENLSLKTRIALKIHLVFCKNCSRYEKQLKAVVSSIRGAKEKLNTYSLGEDAKLSESSRKRIKRFLSSYRGSK